MKPLPTIAIALSVIAVAAVWAQSVEQFEPAQPTWSRLVTVTNFPNPQNVAGTVNVGNLPTDTDGNVKVAVQNGGASTPAPSMFVELLGSPLPMIDGDMFYSDVVDTSGYTVVGVAVSAGMNTQLVSEWRWDPVQSFGWVTVEGLSACSFTANSTVSRSLCAVRGPELRVSVRAYQDGTLDSLQVFLTNDLVLP